MVFQDFIGSFDLCWCVEKLVVELFYLMGCFVDWCECVVEVLYDVGIGGDVMQCYIYEFLGGQWQCIVFVCVIIICLVLIVLDEVVSVLDVCVWVQVLDLLVWLWVCYGLFYLFVSYDLFVVWQVMDCVFIMWQGKIVEYGLIVDVMKMLCELYIW